MNVLALAQLGVHNAVPRLRPQRLRRGRVRAARDQDVPLPTLRVRPLPLLTRRRLRGGGHRRKGRKEDVSRKITCLLHTRTQPSSSEREQVYIAFGVEIGLVEQCKWRSLCRQGNVVEDLCSVHGQPHLLPRVSGQPLGHRTHLDPRAEVGSLYIVRVFVRTDASDAKRRSDKRGTSFNGISF